MTAPRHLWSGDWRRESAAAAEELATRRAAREAPAGSPPSAPPRPPPAVSRTIRLRPARLAVMGALALVTAAAGYAIISALASTGGGARSHAVSASATSPRAATGAPAAVPAWLGVDTADLPGTIGAVVVATVPGGPAQSAGLRAGDVITQINGRPVQTTADLEAILASMSPGDRAQVQYVRGPISITALARLTGRPANGP